MTSAYLATQALERLRMLALGNDYANEDAVRRDYELVSEALDLVELLERPTELPSDTGPKP